MKSSSDLQYSQSLSLCKHPQVSHSRKFSILQFSPFLLPQDMILLLVWPSPSWEGGVDWLPPILHHWLKPVLPSPGFPIHPSMGAELKHHFLIFRFFDFSSESDIHGHPFLDPVSCSDFCKYSLSVSFFSFLVFKKQFYLFISRREGRKKERERNINVWLPCACPLPGTWPTTQACALTGNRTGNPLLCRPALSPLSLTSQGNLLFFFNSASLLSHPWWGSPTPTIDDLTSSWSNLISILVKMLFSSSVSLSVALEPHF